MRQLGTTMTTKRDLKIPVALSNGEADWIEEGKPMTFMDAEFGICYGTEHGAESYSWHTS